MNSKKSRQRSAIYRRNESMSGNAAKTGTPPDGPTLIACVAIENQLAYGRTLAQVIGGNLDLAVGLDLFLERQEIAANEIGEILGRQTADYQHGFDDGFEQGQKEALQRTAQDVGKIIHGVMPPPS